jgi:hypothetical protein
MSPSPYPAGGQDFGKTFGDPVKQEEGQDVATPKLDNPNNCMEVPVLIEQILTIH